MRVTPFNPHFIKPELGKIFEQRRSQQRTTSLQPLEFMHLAALWKVGCVIEGSKRDLCLDTLEDFLQLLSVR
ncbi:hypothetical protein D3C86_2200770 [compost metagenome]